MFGNFYVYSYSYILSEYFLGWSSDVSDGLQI